MQNVHAPASTRVAATRLTRDTPGLAMIAAKIRSDNGRKPLATMRPWVTSLATMSTATKYSSTPVAMPTRMRACSCSLSGRAASLARSAVRVMGNPTRRRPGSLSLLIGEALADGQHFLALACQDFHELRVEVLADVVLHVRQIGRASCRERV